VLPPAPRLTLIFDPTAHPPRSDTLEVGVSWHPLGRRFLEKCPFGTSQTPKAGSAPAPGNTIKLTNNALQCPPGRTDLIIVHGIYRFRPKRVAFRNDYCFSCARPCRSIQVRTFDVWHLFWIPLLPLGFRKPWCCTTCRRPPHAYPGTRRGFKWAGLGVLLFLAAAFWFAPLTPDMLVMGWLCRVGAPIGAIFTLRHILRAPEEPSLREKLAAIPSASDTVCPFCGSALLFQSSRYSCPACGVVRV